MFGKLCLPETFPTIPPALGGRERLTNCWNATDDIGGTSKNDPGWRHRRYECAHGALRCAERPIESGKTWSFSQPALSRSGKDSCRICTERGSSAIQSMFRH